MDPSLARFLNFVRADDAPCRLGIGPLLRLPDHAPRALQPATPALFFPQQICDWRRASLPLARRSSGRIGATRRRIWAAGYGSTLTSPRTVAIIPLQVTSWRARCPIGRLRALGLPTSHPEWMV